MRFAKEYVDPELLEALLPDLGRPGTNYDQYEILTPPAEGGYSTFKLTPELEEFLASQRGFRHHGMMGGPTPDQY